jgi:hypothetical protein
MTPIQVSGAAAVEAGKVLATGVVAAVVDVVEADAAVASA